MIIGQDKMVMAVNDVYSLAIMWDCVMLIEIFDWSYLFSGKIVHEQVGLFNKTLLNIFPNFIPNKIILCDDKDPPWMNDEIKKLIKRKKLAILVSKKVRQPSISHKNY